jgi:chemotaxis regulatin CheY-phosphate phosphatase CheZ
VEAEKSGKVKITFEVEINQPAMELIKENLEVMQQMWPQWMKMWMENMGAKGKGGHGMGMLMHHGQE